MRGVLFSKNEIYIFVNFEINLVIVVRNAEKSSPIRIYKKKCKRKNDSEGVEEEKRISMIFSLLFVRVTMSEDAKESVSEIERQTTRKL